MKIKNTTFIQKHIEKVVLASAGVVFLLVVSYYLLHVPAQPFEVKLADGKEIKAQAISDVPRQLHDIADTLSKKIKGASRVRPDEHPTPDYPQLLNDLRAVPVVLGKSLPIIGDYPLSGEDAKPTPVNFRPYFLPHPPMPKGDKAVTGNVVLASGEDSVYVSVEAMLDLPAWYQRMTDAAGLRKEGEQPMSQSIAKQGLQVAGVYLEREQWDPARRAFGKSVRITLEGQSCYFEEQEVWNTTEDKDRDKALALIKSIKDNQTQIQRPDFPPLDPASPLPLLRETPAAAPAATVVAPSGRFDEVQEPEVQPVRLWCHDLTAQAGQKYRYRLVATVLNPLYNFSTTSLAPEQVKQNATRVALAPQPSEVKKTPWVDVVVPRNFHCFFTEVVGIRAKFEVWKVVSGTWVGQTFETKVGDAIGSKQAIVTFPDGTTRPVDLDSQKIMVDILDVTDPEYPERKAKSALLMNADGSLETRLASQDINSPERKGVQGKSDVPALGAVPGDSRPRQR